MKKLFLVLTAILLILAACGPTEWDLNSNELQGDQAGVRVVAKLPSLFTPKILPGDADPSGKSYIVKTLVTLAGSTEVVNNPLVTTYNDSTETTFEIGDIYLIKGIHYDLYVIFYDSTETPSYETDSEIGMARYLGYLGDFTVDDTTTATVMCYEATFTDLQVTAATPTELYVTTTEPFTGDQKLFAVFDVTVNYKLVDSTNLGQFTPSDETIYGAFQNIGDWEIPADQDPYKTYVNGEFKDDNAIAGNQLYNLGGSSWIKISGQVAVPLNSETMEPEIDPTTAPLNFFVRINSPFIDRFTKAFDITNTVLDLFDTLPVYSE